MATAAQVLAKFAAELTFEEIPSAVIERAKDCIIDTVAAATCGSKLPWSRIAMDYAIRYGSGGPCTIIGNPDAHVHAPYAALANGVFSHAFEQDSVRDPGAGTHPGATLMPPVLAACEETGADGKSALTAFIAGCEVMFRIATASHHSPEKLGFHAPGLTGPYGAAIAAGRLFGLNAEQLAHALGIAGSLSSGLLAFTKSKSGGMIKRLHLGRASESGILAARLAGAGYTGPETVLEGKFGFLEVYCLKDVVEPALLTAGLRENWETLRLCTKRYPCHINAHTSVQAMRELMAEHAFTGNDVAKVVIEGTSVHLTHHNIVEPGDIMQAQYSLPFCVSLAMFRDPEDPRSFDAAAVDDPQIRAACRALEIRPRSGTGHPVRSARVNVKLKDGREFARNGDWFKGMPDHPLTRAELRRKFMLLSAGGDDAAAQRRFERLERLETQPKFSPA
jgi:2-methylcitrate dehydratase PrpD